MNITFQNEEQLFDFLVLDQKVVWNDYSDQPITFGVRKFSQSDFLEFLKSFDLITYNYECLIGNTSVWKRELRTKELRLRSIELNYKNLELLYSDNLVTPDILQHRLLTINEVCEVLNVTRPTVYKLFEDGSLSYYEILSQRKVKYSDLLKFLELKKQKWKIPNLKIRDFQKNIKLQFSETSWVELSNL